MWFISIKLLASHTFPKKNLLPEIGHHFVTPGNIQMGRVTWKIKKLVKHGKTFATHYTLKFLCKCVFFKHIIGVYVLLIARCNPNFEPIVLCILGVWFTWDLKGYGRQIHVIASLYLKVWYILLTKNIVSRPPFGWSLKTPSIQ